MIISIHSMTPIEENYLLNELQSLQNDIRKDKTILNEDASSMSKFQMIVKNKDDIIKFYKDITDNKDKGFERNIEKIEENEDKLRMYIGMKEKVNVSSEKESAALFSKYAGFEKSPWWYKAIKVASIFTLGVIGTFLFALSVKIIVSTMITTILASIVASILMYKSAANAFDILKNASSLREYRQVLLHLLISTASLMILNQFLIDSAVGIALPMLGLVASGIFITIFIYYLWTYIIPLIKYSVKEKMGVPLDAR